MSTAGRRANSGGLPTPGKGTDPQSGRGSDPCCPGTSPEDEGSVTQPDPQGNRRPSPLTSGTLARPSRGDGEQTVGAGLGLGFDGDSSCWDDGNLRGRWRQAHDSVNSELRTPCGRDGELPGVCFQSQLKILLKNPLLGTGSSCRAGGAGRGPADVAGPCGLGRQGCGLAGETPTGGRAEAQPPGAAGRTSRSRSCGSWRGLRGLLVPSNSPSLGRALGAVSVAVLRGETSRGGRTVSVGVGPCAPHMEAGRGGARVQAAGGFTLGRPSPELGLARLEKWTPRTQASE